MARGAPVRPKRTVAEEALTGAAEIFKTLSDPTRLRILGLLQHGELCVSEVSARLEMSQTAVSHQLRTLRVAHLVATRRAGREIYYSLADEHVLSLVKAAVSHAQERMVGWRRREPRS
jgi:DNA-binding transcriptional ArsR family regulator